MFKQTFPEPENCINCHKEFTPTNPAEAISHKKIRQGVWETGRKCRKCTTGMQTSKDSLSNWDKRYRRLYNEQNYQEQEEEEEATKAPVLKKKIVSWDDLIKRLGVKKRENVFAKAERCKLERSVRRKI